MQEDVLRLVEITEDIKRERRERIREIQWEREESERLPKMLPPPPPIEARFTPASHRGRRCHTRPPPLYPTGHVLASRWQSRSLCK